MYELLRQGMLMVNLVGHGSNVSWTGEEMITLQDIDNMYFKRLPLWITATCDFSRFDDYTTSAGEKMLFHPQGGAIGLFSTTRVVYSGPNFIINDHLCRNLFQNELSDPIRWNLTDHTGKTIEPGVYIFRVFIATANSKYISEAKKMIVVSQ